MSGSLPFDVAMIFRAAGPDSKRLGLFWFTRRRGTEAEIIGDMPLLSPSHE